MDSNKKQTKYKPDPEIKLGIPEIKSKVYRRALFTIIRRQKTGSKKIIEHSKTI